MEPPTVGVALNYGMSLTVACVVSQTENILIEVDDVGRGEVIIDFPSLPLRKGVYYVATTLNVDDSLPKSGVVNLDHKWDAIKAHSNCSKRNSKLRQ